MRIDKYAACDNSFLIVMFNDKEDIRPDKILEKRLLLLVLMLTSTILSIGFLFANPTYLRPIILAIFIFITLSIYLTITILQSGETAILYGGLANEILKSTYKININRKMIAISTLIFGSDISPE